MNKKIFDPYLVLSVMGDLENLPFSPWNAEVEAFERIRVIYAQRFKEHPLINPDVEEIKKLAKAQWLVEYAEECFNRIP